MNNKAIKQTKCLSKLLSNEKYNNQVIFDLKSYDNENDYPFIIIDNEKIIVEKIFINDDTITIISKDDKYTLCLSSCYFSDKDFEDMGLFSLLNDTYNETEYPNTIGDFENIIND